LAASEHCWPFSDVDGLRRCTQQRRALRVQLFDPASGEGARLYGARWNSPGHTGRQIPKKQVCVTFEVPEAVSTETLDLVRHPGWEAADAVVGRAAGDAWLAGAQSAVLLVPSVVFDFERNALINPDRPDAARIQSVSVESVRWEDRLFTLLHP
jgi:RES domain-containing protein